MAGPGTVLDQADDHARALPGRRPAARRGRLQNTVIVGAGDIGQLICRKLINDPDCGANVVGFVDRAPKIRHPDLPEHLSVLGGPEHLPQIIASLDIERVVVSFSNEAAPALVAILRRVRRMGVEIDLVPWLFELVVPGVSIHAVGELPLIRLPKLIDS